MITPTQKIAQGLLAGNITTVEELLAAKRRLAKRFGQGLPTNAELLAVLPRTEAAAGLRRLLRRRAIRTLSGVAPVAVLTKPFACPGRCVYCPTEPEVPQSYLSNEPAVMRAIRCGYEPSVQVADRLQALVANGHEPDKIELIVIGGTWSVLPQKYKYWYIASCFKAANGFKLQRTSSKGQAPKDKIPSDIPLAKLKEILATEQRRNERAKHRIIGLTLETRPDYIDEKELLEMRELGCTRVELGVQAIDDKILVLNKRGHGVQTIARATELLRRYGFKITYHLMPGLPGATPAKDLKMFRQLFADPRFQPDQLKFYPTVVTRGSELYRWWQAGKYKPYGQRTLEKLIADCKASVPPYVRIIRLIRDIPGESIVAGNKITNLRQVMQKRGVVCRCIRCREARQQPAGEHKLNVISYDVSGGREYFIEAASPDGRVLYGFCRLFLPDDKRHGLPALADAGIVRELHVYGELVPMGKGRKVQHRGLGKALLAQAEELVQAAGHRGVAVIAGVGVRDYYRKQGYRLSRTYLAKRLDG